MVGKIGDARESETGWIRTKKMKKRSWRRTSERRIKY